MLQPRSEKFHQVRRLVGVPTDDHPLSSTCNSSKVSLGKQKKFADEERRRRLQKQTLQPSDLVGSLSRLIDGPHPLSSNTISHPLSSNTMSHPLSSNTISHPLSSNTISHPLSSNTISHPLSSNTMSHHLSSNTISHPLSSNTMSHPLSSNTMSHPLSSTTISHPLSSSTFCRSLTSTTTSHPLPTDSLCSLSASLQVTTWQTMCSSLLTEFPGHGADVRPGQVRSGQQCALVLVAGVGDGLLSGVPVLTVFPGSSWRLIQLETAADQAAAAGQKTVPQYRQLSDYLSSASSEVLAAWGRGQRVRALKLVIQCCKLLQEVARPAFYPLIFCHVTRLLDTFSGLVRDRLMAQIGSDGHASGQSATETNSHCESDSGAATETMLNWHHKISSIKELVPRVYLEAALVHCFQLICASSCDSEVARLSGCINGVGQPLVAAYLRCYLCHVTGPNQQVLDDFLARLPAAASQAVSIGPDGDVTGGEKRGGSGGTLVLEDGRSLLLAPLQWCVENALACGHVAAETSVLQLCAGDSVQTAATAAGGAAADESSSLPSTATVYRRLLLLTCLARALPARRVASLCAELLQLVTSPTISVLDRLQQQQPEAQAEGGASVALQFLVEQLLRALGEKLCVLPSAELSGCGCEVRAAAVPVWSLLVRLSAGRHLRCAAVWLPLVVRHLKARHIRRVLAQLFGQAVSIAPLQRPQPLLEQIIVQVIGACSPPTSHSSLQCAESGHFTAKCCQVLCSSELAALLELVQQKGARLRVYSCLLRTVCDQTALSASLVECGVMCSRAVADCCTPRRQQCHTSSSPSSCSEPDQLVALFVRTAWHQLLSSPAGASCSQLLELLTEVRAACCHQLPGVTEQLVLLACSLLADQSRDIGSATAGAVAFSHVTTLRVEAPAARLRLLTLVCQMTLRHRLLPQAVTCARAALSALRHLISPSPASASVSLCVQLSGLLALPELAHHREPLLAEMIGLLGTRCRPAFGWTLLASVLRLLDTLSKGSEGDWRQALHRLAEQTVQAADHLLTTSVGQRHVLTDSAVTAAARLALAMLNCCHICDSLVLNTARRLHALCSPRPGVSSQLLSSLRDLMALRRDQC